MVVAVTLFLN